MDEPNVLAHIRFNERVDPDGKKVLFIEEIQSDWAQKGRKQGFSTPIEGELRNKLQKEMSGKQIQLEEAAKKYFGGISEPGREINDLLHQINVNTPSEFAKYLGIPNDEASTIFNLPMEMGALDNRLVGTGQGSGIPRGPFLEDTNQWANLSLKRMIRWAADNNFDSIGWTTGKQQAARYDLSTQLDELAYRIDEDGNYNLQGLKDEHKAFDTTVKESELSDTVGKEMAEKMIKKEGKQAYHTDGSKVPETKIFSGIDLEIGGEGMAGFYDDIVVNQAKKIGKKHGAKVEKTDLINKKIDKSAMVSEEKITGWDQQLEETGISTHYDIDAGDDGFVVFSRHENPDDWISAEEMRMAGGVKVDEWQAHLAEQIANAYRQNHSAKQAIKIANASESTVWTMKLTDKLKKAAKEGLPYYAVMPPALLAAGAQEERQSLLE
jgi:hypothetical protein